MWVRSQPGVDLLVVARVYSLDEVAVAVHIDGKDVGVWRYPNTEGHWAEVTFRVPGELITSSPIRFETVVVPAANRQIWHAPFHYWFWQGARAPQGHRMGYPLQANLDGKVQLLGYDLETARVQPGDILRLTLYWEALEPMQKSYTVFTHLYDQNDKIWGQKDGVPVEGTWPTTLWVKGEVVADPREVLIREDAPPGRYQIAIGIYDSLTSQRLPVLAEGSNREPDDKILLTTVDVMSGER